jgi:nucleotide-binding universal stress UspA family protein
MSARIVVGVDGSDHAARALRFAFEEARRRGDAVVEAVHSYHAVVYMPGVEFGYVMPPTRVELEAEAKRRLEHALRDVPDGVRVEQIVVADSPARALIETGKGADLLVIGTRGHGGFRGLLLGSTSMQVVTHAPCPVVVVPGARVED